MGNSGTTGSGVIVVVDEREQRSPLLAHLRERWPRTIEGRLPVGDVGIGPRVLVERKTIADLAASLSDGRLFRQAYALAGCAERPLFVIEGILDVAAVEQTGLSPNAYRSVMLSLLVGYGIGVIRTRSVHETTVWLSRLADRESRRFRRIVRAPEAPAREEPETAMLASLPGIGARRAARLMEEFGSVRAVLDADPKRLRRVEGIGKALAGYLSSLGRSPSGRRDRGESGADTLPDVVSEPATRFGPC